MQVLRDAGDSGGASGGGKWDPRGRKGGTKGLCVCVRVSVSVCAMMNPPNVWTQLTSERHVAASSTGPSSVFKIVKMIMERNFQPVIIFSFSKKECEAYALQVAKLDFNKGV